MIYGGICGMLLTLVPHLRLHKRALQFYWVSNVLIFGIWLISEFSAQNWLVTSKPLQWIIALWLNATMAYCATGGGFLVLRLLLRIARQKLNIRFWHQPNSILIPFVWMLSAFGVYEAMSQPLLRHYDVYLDQLPTGLDGLKIAQITDSHVGDFISGQDLSSAVKRLNDTKPDLLVMTGDLLDDERQLDSSFAALAETTAPMGVIAILGNHEKYHGLPEILQKYKDEAKQTPIRLLVDESMPLTYNTTEFQVVGVDYPMPPNARGEHIEKPAEENWMQYSAKKAFAHVKKDEWILCLTHHPNFFDFAAANNASLSLAGHTHGGQVLPLGYTVGRYQYDFYYLKGWFQKQQHQLFVSVGMGHVWPYRLGVPPEIVTFTLHQKK
jgi:uncharacterized protein